MSCSHAFNAHVIAAGSFLSLVAFSLPCSASEPSFAHFGGTSGFSHQSTSQFGNAVNARFPVTFSLASYKSPQQSMSPSLTPPRPLRPTKANSFTRHWSQQFGFSVSSTVLNSTSPPVSLAEHVHNGASRRNWALQTPNVLATGLNASKYKLRSTGVPSRYR